MSTAVHMEPKYVNFIFNLWLHNYFTDVNPYTKSMHFLQFYFKMQYLYLTAKNWKKINSTVTRKTYGCCGQR